MAATGRDAPAQSATADREIVISRVISAPRELVFEAFTEVRHLSRWWGPDGFTTTTRAFEFRVGGEWDFVMHGPDGTDYQEWISWTEIAPPERIALLHGESRGDPNAFESVLTFAPDGAATRIEMRTVFPTKELRDEAVEKYHAIEGGQQTLSNLAAYVTEIVRTQLGQQPSTGETVLLTGAYHLEAEVSRRLSASLPHLLVLTARDWTTPLVRCWPRSRQGRAGPEAVLDRLLDLLLIAACAPGSPVPHPDAAWYRGYGDPIVGRALRLSSTIPARPLDGGRARRRDRRVAGGAGPPVPRAGRRAADDLPDELAPRARRRPPPRARRRPRRRRPAGRLRHPVRAQHRVQARARREPARLPRSPRSGARS